MLKQLTSALSGGRSSPAILADPELLLTGEPSHSPNMYLLLFDLLDMSDSSIRCKICGIKDPITGSI